MLSRFLVLSVAIAAALPVRAEQYPIGPGDVVDISVFARPELSRLYRVRADGTITLHLIGAVPAAGLTTAALEAALEDLLAATLEGPSSTTVEIAEHRPVIVTGRVQAPGAYDFLEGLDIAGALALAGGPRLFDATLDTGASMRVEAEAGRNAELRARLAALDVERARLASELAALEHSPAAAPVPIGAAGEDMAIGDTTTLVQRNNALLDIDHERLTRQVAANESQRDLAREEAAAFAERQGLIRSQIEATAAAISDQERLVEQGLGLTDRLLDLKLEETQYRADELSAVALAAAARQRAEASDVAALATVTQRRIEVLRRLSQLEAENLAARTEEATSRRFVQRFGGTVITDAEGQEAVGFVVHRRRGADLDRIEGQPDTLLWPGDRLEVVFTDNDAAAADGTQGDR